MTAGRRTGEIVFIFPMLAAVEGIFYLYVGERGRGEREREMGVHKTTSCK